MNQSAKPQVVKVKFDSQALGSHEIDAGMAKTFAGTDGKAGSVKVSRNVATLELPPRATLGLTLQGVKIDVPTHRVKPPQFLKMPEIPASVIAWRVKRRSGWKLRGFRSSSRCPLGIRRDPSSGRWMWFCRMGA